MSFALNMETVIFAEMLEGLQQIIWFKSRRYRLQLWEIKDMNQQCPRDGGDMFLRNIRLSPNYTALQHRRP
jgi:hypothetical protein